MRRASSQAHEKEDKNGLNRARQISSGFSLLSFFWGTVLFIFRTADKFHAQLELRKGLASAPFPFSPSLSFISNDGGKEGDKTESVLVVKSNDPTDVYMINKVDQVF